VKYDGKFASRWRAKSPDALCAVLPKTKATPHKALYSVFPRNAWHRKTSKSVLDFVESCRM
ncbi:hypothetical protein, partial [uncultured Ruminococcus sp.]|uniref:hypothetical protein n=1 Tax=uncultured Ruminococcus sp. TaxID=165186 RepID=UPI00258AC657